MLYLTTDGYVEQQNGNRKKIGSTKFLEVLKNNTYLPLKKQQEALENELDSHQQNELQRDDISIMGIKT